MNNSQQCQGMLAEITSRVRILRAKREANVGLWRSQVLDNKEEEKQIAILWEKLRRMRSRDKRPFALLDFSKSKLFEGKRAYSGA